MHRIRKHLLIGSLLVLLTVAVAAAPGVVSSTQSFYNRIEVLGRMFEIIEMHYVEDVDADAMFRYAVDGVLENLDPHSRYYTAEEYRELTERYRGDYFGIGIQFDIFDGVLTVLDALEGGPSAKLGLRPGDQIVKINGESAIGLDNDQVFERLRGPKGTTVNVTVRRPALDDEWEVKITRDQVEVSPISAATMLDGVVGYVWLNTFSQKGADQLEQHLRKLEAEGMQAFILDLRGNRGGLMSQAVRITDKFVSGGKRIVYTKGRNPNASGENYSTERDTHKRWPMIVLVDHNSASASEIVAGALQDWDRALIVGQLTWGKALVQNQFPFSDGSALFLTIARYYTPSGRLIQRPYQGGDYDEYNNPDWEAIESAAQNSASEPSAEPGDSPNKERPLFYTAGGRPVRGGGGIAPDIEVKPTKVSALAIWLFNRRLGFQFATKYVAENAAALPTDLDGYLNSFEVNDELLAQFEEFLRTPPVKELIDRAEAPLDEETLSKARDDIRMYLKADIASNLWGLEAGRIVLLEYDGQVQRALGLVPEAAALLDVPPQVAERDGLGEPVTGPVEPLAGNAADCATTVRTIPAGRSIAAP